MMQIQLRQANEGVIIVDVVLNMSGSHPLPVPLELTVQLDKLDMELQGQTYRIVDIGNTTLTPTVKTNVSGIDFNETAKTLHVIGADGRSTVYSASTDNRLVQVRVNFVTKSVTIYE